MSQPVFAFEREDPAGGTKQQLTSTRLPQRFKNSPTIFGEALASDLDSFQPERFRGRLLQCVDDLLLIAKNKKDRWEGIKALLELLMESGYRVLKKKAQICKKEIRYLEFVESRHEAVRPVEKRCHFENPTTKKQTTGPRVLGSHWFCRIWIPSYSQMAQPLYKLLTGPEGDSLNWTERQQQAFEELKLAITSAPALVLPDLTKPFTPDITEKDKVGMRVLTQTMGTWDRPMAYLLKRLDNVATG